MCQLSFINLFDRELNIRAATLQMVLNSETTNKDGCGFFNVSGGVWKSKNAASNLVNLGYFLRSKITDNTPIICHVRQATMTKGQKIISVENSHPFDGERFVVAHNGSLESIDAFDTKQEFKDLIDSAIFARALEETAKENPDASFKDILTLTYKNWRGKFGLLVYDKKANAFYAARGETAKLYSAQIKNSDGEYLGYIINTDKDTLTSSLFFLSNLLDKSWIPSEVPTEIVEIPQEKIYNLTPTGYLEIGEIKENKKIIEAVTSSTPPFRGGTTTYATHAEHSNAKHASTSQDITDKVFYGEAEKGFYELMKRWNVTPFYMDTLCVATLGINISQLKSSTELENFVAILERINRDVSHSKIKLWGKILEKCVFETDAHVIGGLAFPYMTCTNRDLMDAWKELNNREKNQASK